MRNQSDPNGNASLEYLLQTFHELHATRGRTADDPGLAKQRLSSLLGGERDVPYRDLVSTLEVIASRFFGDGEVPTLMASRESDVRSYVRSVEAALSSAGVSLAEFSTDIRLLAVLLQQKYSLFKGVRPSVGNVLFGLYRDPELLQKNLFLSDRRLYSEVPLLPIPEQRPSVTVLESSYGCSWGKCTYCSIETERPFFARTPSQFRDHVKAVRAKLGESVGNIRKVFLSGANVFDLPMERFASYVAIALEELDGISTSQGTSAIKKFTAFGRTQGIMNKTDADLEELARNGFRVLYWGVESGCDELLRYVSKGITRREMIQSAQRLHESGIDASVQILIGLGGWRFFYDHIEGTADLLNTLRPRYITLLPLTVPHLSYQKKMASEQREGTNRPLDFLEMAHQLRKLMMKLDIDGQCDVSYVDFPELGAKASDSLGFSINLLNGKQGVIDNIERYIQEHNGRL